MLKWNWNIQLSNSCLWLKSMLPSLQHRWLR